MLTLLAIGLTIKKNYVLPFFYVKIDLLIIEILIKNYKILNIILVKTSNSVNFVIRLHYNVLI